MRIYEKNRKAYRKSIPVQTGCVFCDPEVRRAQEITSLETDHWLVIASKYPYLDGNVMIIPKEHKENTSDLSKGEWDEFPMVLEKAKKALEALFETDSFNLALNIGKNSGNSIPHLHWQLLPRTHFNPNAFNIFHDLHLITMDHQELIEQLNALHTTEKE